MTVPLRKRIKRSVRSALLRALIQLVARVPLRVALALATRRRARSGGSLAGRTRRQMLAHLAIAFPEKTAAEREAIGRASLVHLAWLAAEVATLRTWRHRLPEYVSFAPGAEERLRAAPRAGKGLVYVTGHVGNWELMAQRVAARPRPSATIARRPATTRGSPRSSSGVRARGEGRDALARGPGDRARDDPLLQAGQAPRDPHRPGHERAGRLRAVLRPPGVHAAGGRRPRAPLRGPRRRRDWCRRRGPRPGDGHEIDRGRGALRPRTRPTARRRWSGSRPPARPSSRRPSAGTRPSGSGCTSAGRRTRRRGAGPRRPKQSRCRKARAFRRLADAGL